jgi:TetR/AcrR family transcriptional regulator, cholesterol catabolism regulator
MLLTPVAIRPAEEPGTRQRVLRAAAALFRTQGYAATSLRDIAAAAGLKAGSLYNHFSSKEDIVTTILDLGVKTVFERVRGSIEALEEGASCSAMLRAGIEAHLDCLLGEDNLTSANIRIFAHVPPHVREATMPLRHAYEDYWVELLKHCAENGTLRPEADSKLLSMFLFGSMNWALEWYRPARHDIGTLADQLTRFFLHGGAAE